MPLTAEQFEQVTRFLAKPVWRLEPALYAGSERREAAGTPARGVAELRVAGVGRVPGEPGRTRSVTVYVHDVSTGGVGLLSGAAVRAESAVELVLSNGHDDLTLRCSVRHCAALAVGLYGVGMDVEQFEVREATPESAAAEAAWAGFFGAQRATSARDVAG
jgi:hypothetical protein